MKKTTNKKKKSTEVKIKPTNIKNYYYILGLIVFFVFANTISGGYNLDDELVTLNHRFTSQGLEAVKDIFTNPYYADDMGYAYGYRPMVHLSFAIEHQFFGENPQVSHFFNVLLYLFSVVLFFKLLMKWFGIEQLKLAFLAVILFALHPIHTEVVASIKNRDEILAFLFIITSGLSMIKYLDKRKVSSVIWLIVFFTMAMLSKKSAYSMAIVLPFGILLFRNISIKQLALISFSVIIPAALIGSELNVVRMISMIAFPVVGIGLVYNFKIKILRKELNTYAVISNLLFPTTLLVLITGWSFYTLTFSGLFFTIPFLIWVFRINFQTGLVAIIMLSYAIDEQFGNYELGFLPVLITIGYSCYLIVNHKKSLQISKKKGILWLLLLIASVSIHTFHSHEVDDILELLTIGVFFWLLFKNSLWGVVFTLIFATTFILFRDVYLFSTSLLCFSILFYLKEKVKVNYFNFYSYFLVLLYAILLVLFLYENDKLNPIGTAKNELTLAAKETSDERETRSFLKEGRDLEFVENSLVVPHTTQETIGTGFATLGEYFRLMVFPYELSFYYGFARMETVSLANPFVWSSILVHLGLIFLAIWNLRKRPIISVGIIWYLFSIILFSNWLELVAGMVAERLAFIASAGFSIFLAGMVFWLKPQFLSKKPFMLEGLIAIVLILFTVKTIHRNTSWKDPITLMGSDINHLKNSAQANNLYANNLVVSTFNPESNLTQEEKKVRYHLALKHYGQALQVYPNFYNAAFDRGRLSEIVQDTSLAIQSYKQAIEMQQSDFPDPFYNLCNIYLNKSDFSNYLKYAKPLIYFDSLNIQAYSNLARAFYLNNKKDSATFVLKRAITLFPEDLELKQSIEFLNQQEN